MNSVLEQINGFEVALNSLDDEAVLHEVRVKLADLLDRLEDRLDLHFIEERRNEPTISHAQLTQELRNDGLI